MAEYVLRHHGILGQKWGVRRYQNPDGTLTAEGRKRAGQDFANDEFGKKRLSYNKVLNKYSDNGLFKSMLTDENVRNSLEETNTALQNRKEYSNRIARMNEDNKPLTSEDLSRLLYLNDKVDETHIKLGQAISNNLDLEVSSIKTLAFASYLNEYIRVNEED